MEVILDVSLALLPSSESVPVMFQLFTSRAQQPTTLLDAELATNGFIVFADKEIEERRINPNLPPEEDPPSHRLVRDVQESAQRLERLRHAPQITAALAAPASLSLFGSLWGSSGSAPQVDPFKDHTKQVKRSHDKAMLVSKLRRKHESIFTFALSGVLQTSTRSSNSKGPKPTIINAPATKEDLYKQATRLHQVCVLMKTMLDFDEYGRNRESFAYTEGAQVMVERVAELFEDTLDLFRVWCGTGKSFSQVVHCAEKTIMKYNEIMLVDKGRESTSSFLKALKTGESDESQWKFALESFRKQSSESRSSLTVSASQEDPYEEEARRWNEVMQQTAQPNSVPRIISTSDFSYSLLNEKLPEVLGLPESSVPVLFRGLQATVVRDEDDEPFGSFATVKKYKLPEITPFRIQFNHQEEIWDVDEIAVKYLDIPRGGTAVTREAIRRNSVRIVRELRVWSRVKHENIVPLLGLWLDYKRFRRDEEPSPCPVAPWMGGGNLQTYLSKRPHLSLQDRLGIMRGIISALSYMHNHEYAEIVHGDLKPDNILMKDDKVYLCDFGCSHLLDDVKGLSTDPHGNPSWLAPERIRIEMENGRHTKPTCASDMYAFGLVFLFTVHNKQPFEDYNLSGDDLRQRRKVQDLEPTSVNLLPNEHRSLLVSCWSVGPLLRIPASLALGEVDKLLEISDA